MNSSGASPPIYENDESERASDHNQKIYENSNGEMANVKA